MLSKLLIGLVLLTSLGALAGNDYDKARKATAKALWKEYKVDRVLRQLEKRYVGKDVRAISGIVLPIGRAMYEKRITFRWSF